MALLHKTSLRKWTKKRKLWGTDNYFRYSDLIKALLTLKYKSNPITDPVQTIMNRYNCHLILEDKIDLD